MVLFLLFIVFEFVLLFASHLSSLYNNTSLLLYFIVNAQTALLFVRVVHIEDLRRTGKNTDRVDSSTGTLLYSSWFCVIFIDTVIMINTR